MIRDLFINFCVLVTLTALGNLLVNATPEEPKTWRQRLLTWGVMIAGGLVLMQFPVKVTDGVILAFHTVAPALAGLYGGVSWGLVVGLPLGLARFALGGLGAIPGVVAILITAGMAGLLRIGGEGFTHPLARISWRAPAIFAPALLTLLLVPSHGIELFLRYYVLMTAACSLALLVCIIIIRMRFEAQVTMRLLSNLSMTDPLTGLPNLRSFERDLSQTGPGWCFLLLDVDHFKWINDRLGHSIGDTALRQIADLLRHELRGDDLVFRYGGDEFIILMKDCTLAQAAEVGERIRRSVEQFEVSEPDGSVQTTVSGGVIPWDPALDLTGHIARADRLLYEAKTGGRNRIIVADDGQTLSGT